MQPIYTVENCRAAFELRWSLALFANRAIPAAKTWNDQLACAVEPDGVRILEQTLSSPTTALFFVSTKPHVAPKDIVKSVKGRLQHTIRASHGNLFKRNFSLTSVGVAIGYMNNLGFAHGMKPLLQFGFFVGTFGEYDSGAIRRQFPQSRQRASSHQVI